MDQVSYKGRKSGFTLVELLVSIAVIAVVLAISIPALKSGKDRGLVARSLSGHKNIMVMLDAYSSDRDGVHPYAYTKREGSFAHPVYVVSDHLQDGYSAASMRLQAKIWSSVLAKENSGLSAIVYQGRWAPIVGNDVPNGLIGGSYIATSTLFAHPTYFALDSDSAQARHLKPTRASFIQFPSSKVMFEDLESWGRIPNAEDTEMRSATFSFADGSAAAMSQAEFTGDWVDRVAAWQSEPGHTTLDGLAGRDR